MADIDLALRLLQNKVRRQILERLVREPHYPMQLADLIGVSQQAIKKHLKELENETSSLNLQFQAKRAVLQGQYIRFKRLFQYGLTLDLTCLIVNKENYLREGR